ncbi:SCO4402 family protein [Embleya sp. NPDC055664]
MAGMRQSTVPWWRWRAQVRSALHMFGDPTFQRESWLAGRPDYGSITDAVYRLVGDSWLDRWSATTYIGCLVTDAEEAALVDAAVREILGVLHDVGEDAPAPAYLTHPRWPDVVTASRAAHVALARADEDDPDAPPDSLDVLRIRTGGR